MPLKRGGQSTSREPNSKSNRRQTRIANCPIHSDTIPIRARTELLPKVVDDVGNDTRHLRQATQKPISILSAKGRTHKDEKPDNEEWEECGTTTTYSALQQARTRPIQFESRSVRREWFVSSILDNGYVDPFSALPCNLPRNHVDRRLFEARSILACLVTQGDWNQEYAREFARGMLAPVTSSPALLHAMLYADIIYNRVIGNNIVEPTLELEISSRAIHLISEEMQDPRRAVSEANIWAVVALGFSTRVAPLRAGSEYPQQSFLKELQGLHVYGRMELIIEHMVGLMQLITLLGGLHKVKTVGMAPVISYGGLISACRNLSKPLFPYLPHSSTSIIEGRIAVQDYERRMALPSLGALGSGVWKVWGLAVSSQVERLCLSIQDMCDFTVVVDNYVEGRWTPKTAITLMDHRNFVQHRLMSLNSDLENAGCKGDSLYEACRLATIGYSLLVVFPLPPVIGPFEMLSHQLKSAIGKLHIDVIDRSLLDMQVWILTISAIVAIGLNERQWFVETLRWLTSAAGVKNWDGLRSIARRFLWHSPTSDSDGKHIWHDIERIG